MWWLIFVFACPAYFVETFQHEASHALFAWAQNRGWPRSFKIWPHWVDHDNDPSTRELFFWGRVVYGYPKPGYFDTKKGRAARSWAPFITGIPIWGLCLLYSGYLGELDVLDWAFFTFWGASTVDRVNGLLQPLYRETRGDANKGAAALGLSRFILLPLGVVLSLGLVIGFGLSTFGHLT